MAQKPQFSDPRVARAMSLASARIDRRLGMEMRRLGYHCRPRELCAHLRAHRRLERQLALTHCGGDVAQLYRDIRRVARLLASGQLRLPSGARRRICLATRLKIRDMYMAGEPRRKIAEETGVGLSTIDLTLRTFNLPRRYTPLAPKVRESLIAELRKYPSLSVEVARQIAAALGVSERTVYYHKREMQPEGVLSAGVIPTRRKHPFVVSVHGSQAKRVIKTDDEIMRNLDRLSVAYPSARTTSKSPRHNALIHQIVLGLVRPLPVV